VQQCIDRRWRGRGKAERTGGCCLPGTPVDSTMARAMRSLTLPPGLRNSHLPSSGTRTPAYSRISGSEGSAVPTGRPCRRRSLRLAMAAAGAWRSSHRRTRASYRSTAGLNSADESSISSGRPCRPARPAFGDGGDRSLAAAGPGIVARPRRPALVARRVPRSATGAAAAAQSLMPEPVPGGFLYPGRRPPVARRTLRLATAGPGA
jgi:hypothetical protein